MTFVLRWRSAQLFAINYLPFSGTNSVKVIIVIIMLMASILVPWIVCDRKFSFIMFSVKFFKNITFLMTVSWSSGVRGMISWGRWFSAALQVCDIFMFTFLELIQLLGSSLSKDDCHKFLKFLNADSSSDSSDGRDHQNSSCSYTTGKPELPPPPRTRKTPADQWFSIVGRLIHIRPENFQWQHTTFFSAAIWIPGFLSVLFSQVEFRMKKYK